jgi:Protein of unknown function (DUF1670)
VAVGLQSTQIEQRTGHSEDAIGGYLADFRQIAALSARGATVAELHAVTGRSVSLIAEYVGLDERARREFPAAPAWLTCWTPARTRGGRGEAATPPRLGTYRRLARRNLPALLRYTFLYEDGYDKGPVVVEAIVADLCQLICGWVLRPGDLEPGQLVYPARPPASGPARARRSPRPGCCRCG